jgi:hypothetical protein
MPVLGGIGAGDGSVYYPVSLLCSPFIPHCPAFDYYIQEWNESYVLLFQ